MEGHDEYDNSTEMPNPCTEYQEPSSATIGPAAHSALTTTTDATVPAQQVHIISSDDDNINEDVQSLLSDSGGSGFAGFPSLDTTLHNATFSTNSKCSLKRRSQLSAESGAGDGLVKASTSMELHKRSSYYSLGCDPFAADDDDNDVGDDDPNVDMPHITPVKKKRADVPADTTAVVTNTTANLQTPADQIVEINSNSTTNSQKQKRAQRNTKLQLSLNLNQQQQTTHTNFNTNNKCSTESTSEFPVSSPSNPLPGGCKYPQRTALLKNTLPADAFERNLAMINARNPQMSLEEKIRNWQCAEELSDVEDVNNFDDLFKRREAVKRKKPKNKKEPGDSKDLKAITPNQSDCDFLLFRARLLQGLQTMHKRKDKDTHVIGDKDKPTTSAAAHLAAQRRLKAAAEAEAKKRKQNQTKKATENSTTPPVTTSTASSTENDDDCYQGGATKKKLVKSQQQTSKLQPQKILVYEKVPCPSSSEDASQDATLHKREQKKPMQQSTRDIQQSSPPPPTKPMHWTATDEDSVFKLHRLNRDIDKSTNTSTQQAPQALIQMRLDFGAEKKDLHLKEKASELFKTPNVPQKYLAATALPLYVNNYNSDYAKESVLSSEGIESVSSNYVEGPSTAEAAQQMGAFHQQHEFCSYLGLTGMSTAHAVANAVAELANCKLARRSLRVRRLQQQEKKEKQDNSAGGSNSSSNTKQQQLQQEDSEQLEALKFKQLRALKRREKGGQDVISNCSADMLNTEREITPTRMPSDTRTQSIIGSNGLVTSLTPTSQLTTVKKEPEIKILCHITATSKEEVEKVSKTYAKQLTAPIRRTLMRQFKREDVTATTANTPSIDTSTCPRSSRSDADEQHDETNTSSNPTPKQKQSPCISTPTRRAHTHIKRETLSAQSPSNSVKLEELDEADIDMAAPNLQVIHQKYQQYLEVSRQTKPSIFIVQSLDSEEVHKGKKSTMPLAAAVAAAATSPRTNAANVAPIKLSGKNKRGADTHVARVHKSKGRLHKLLTRSALNMSMQRQLRNRKIVFVKTIKRGVARPKTKEATTQKASKATLLSMQRERFATPQTTENKNDIVDSLTTNVVRQVASNVNDAIKLERLGDKSNNSVLFSQQTSKHNNNSKEHAAASDVFATPASQDTGSNVTLKGSTLHNDMQETVVVSSTTNNYDDEATISEEHSQMQQQLANNNTLESSGIHKRSANTALLLQSTVPAHTKEVNEIIAKNLSFVIASSIVTKDSATQSSSAQHNGCKDIGADIRYLVQPPTTSMLRNPLKMEQHGAVIYIYYELDVLIVVQELLVSFWKYSKLISVLSMPHKNHHHHNHHHSQHNHARDPEPTSTASTDAAPTGEWLILGESRRLCNDIEISTPYANRICVHNSIPIYLEMRCRELPHERRDCNLLSMYINVYYYHDEELHAKMHSIQLDSVQSIPHNVIYTTITESRYFVMSWPQENILGKVRSGLCKYSLTPHLDTLASIREFKSMRHEINYLDCTDDDKLLGFGATQLTIWDHRSGDVLMNYDLDLPLGRNLGSIYYPSLEIGQNNMLLLFQHTQNGAANGAPELSVIACSISHSAPSHRVLQQHALPTPAFKQIASAINTGEHLLLTAHSDEELWISCANPNMITYVPAQHTQRFYARARTQLIELTAHTLTVDSFANHVLKLAAGR